MILLIGIGYWIVYALGIVTGVLLLIIYSAIMMSRHASDWWSSGTDRLRGTEPGLREKQ